MTNHGTATGLVLTGPSSVGKTTIARALLDRLPSRWVFLQADRWLEHKTVPRGTVPTVADVADDLAIRAAGIEAAETCIRLGLDTIVEGFLGDAWARTLASETFAPLHVLILRLRCDLAVLEEREGRRADIHPGFARWQYENESSDYPVDLLLETDEASPPDLAARVVGWLEGLPTPVAFRAMHAAG